MHFPLSFCKNASPTFSMVHLLHRLYGVDAPGFVVLFTKRYEKFIGTVTELS